MMKYVLGCLLFLLPILGFADSTTDALSFTPPPSDFSVIFLGNLFGTVDGVLHGSGSQIMGAIFKVFNSAVLALGGIIIMYILLVSTMNTAHQGEMMGKWSSIWVPMRATIGLALLIPKASGYCLMQIFVMWIVVQGVGAADKVWAAALSYLNRGGTIIQQQVDPTKALLDEATGETSEVASGAENILAGQVCMLGLQKQLEAQREIYKEQEKSNAGPCVGATGSMKQFCDTPVPDFINSVNPVAVPQTRIENGVTVKAADTFSVKMPNFSTDEAPYQELNGICGELKWNYLDTSDTNKISSLSTQESNIVSQSRPLALQQMYLDLAQVARIMVNNDPKINTGTGVSSTSTENYYADWAKQSYGLPFDTSGNVCSTATASTEACNNWGPADSNTGNLFTGTELQGAIADYNGIMMPTLTLIQQTKSKYTEVCYADDKGIMPVKCDNPNVVKRETIEKDPSGIANQNRKFIQQTKDRGWITAGSYFFNLINLSQAAVSNGELIDRNTGINTTVGPTAETLTSSFGENNTCVTTSSGGEQVYGDLCVWFNKDQTKVDAVVELIGTPGNSQVITDKTSATAYGYANNSTLMVLPGQPATRKPNKSGIDVNYVASQHKISKQKFGCNGFKLLGKRICIGKFMADVLYNKMFVGIWNNLLAMVNPFFDKIFFNLVSLPANAMSEIFKQGVQVLMVPGANPVVALAKMGTYFINFAGQYWLFIMEIGLVVAKIPVLGLLVLAIYGLALPLITAWMGLMVGLGAITAYYIPFLPYMIFTFGSIAWLIAVIESMVAAPILALGITHPEGHEAFGKGEQGIMILMNVFLRPSMMIIGFITGIALSYVGVWILNMGFDNAIAFLDADAFAESKAVKSSVGTVSGGYTNWAGLFGYVFGIIAYVSMYMIIVQRSFSLIAVLPDQVLRWIGGQAERSGQEAAQWADEAKGKIEQGHEKIEPAKGEIQTKSAGLVGGAGSAAKAGSKKIKKAMQAPSISVSSGGDKEE